ncbi:hypothetical protein HK102_000953, partial [Quaeritorhiza haematococci]
MNITRAIPLMMSPTTTAMWHKLLAEKSPSVLFLRIVDETKIVMVVGSRTSAGSPGRSRIAYESVVCSWELQLTTPEVATMYGVDPTQYTQLWRLVSTHDIKNSFVSALHLLPLHTNELSSVADTKPPGSHMLLIGLENGTYEVRDVAKLENGFMLSHLFGIAPDAVSRDSSKAAESQKKQAPSTAQKPADFALVEKSAGMEMQIDPAMVPEVPNATASSSAAVNPTEPAKQQQQQESDQFFVMDFLSAGLSIPGLGFGGMGQVAGGGGIPGLGSVMSDVNIPGLGAKPDDSVSLPSSQAPDAVLAPVSVDGTAKLEKIESSTDDGDGGKESTETEADRPDFACAVLGFAVSPNGVNVMIIRDDGRNVSGVDSKRISVEGSMMLRERIVPERDLPERILENVYSIVDTVRFIPDVTTESILARFPWIGDEGSLSLDGPVAGMQVSLFRAMHRSKTEQYTNTFAGLQLLAISESFMKSFEKPVNKVKDALDALLKGPNPWASNTQPTLAIKKESIYHLAPMAAWVLEFTSFLMRQLYLFFHARRKSPTVQPSSDLDSTLSGTPGHPRGASTPGSSGTNPEQTSPGAGKPWAGNLGLLTRPNALVFLFHSGCLRTLVNLLLAIKLYRMNWYLLLQQHRGAAGGAAAAPGLTEEFFFLKQLDSILAKTRLKRETAGQFLLEVSEIVSRHEATMGVRAASGGSVDQAGVGMGGDGASSVGGSDAESNEMLSASEAALGYKPSERWASAADMIIRGVVPKPYLKLLPQIEQAFEKHLPNMYVSPGGSGGSSSGSNASTGGSTGGSKGDDKTGSATNSTPPPSVVSTMLMFHAADVPSLELKPYVEAKEIIFPPALAEQILKVKAAATAGMASPPSASSSTAPSSTTPKQSPQPAPAAWHSPTSSPYRAALSPHHHQQPIPSLSNRFANEFAIVKSHLTALRDHFDVVTKMALWKAPVVRQCTRCFHLSAGAREDEAKEHDEEEAEETGTGSHVGKVKDEASASVKQENIGNGGVEGMEVDNPTTPAPTVSATIATATTPNSTDPPPQKEKEKEKSWIKYPLPAVPEAQKAPLPPAVM